MHRKIYILEIQRKNKKKGEKMDFENALRIVGLGCLIGGILALIGYALRIGTVIDIKTFPQSVSFVGMVAMCVLAIWFESKRITAKGIDGRMLVIIGTLYLVSFVVFGSDVAWKDKSLVLWIFFGAACMAVPGYKIYILIPMVWVYGLLVSGMQGQFITVLFLNEHSGVIVIIKAFGHFVQEILDALRTGLVLQLLH